MTFKKSSDQIHHFSETLLNDDLSPHYKIFEDLFDIMEKMYIQPLFRSRIILIHFHL